jgi:tRNA nucleotidyltransferase (CCA-adding enzyme)
VLDARFRAEEGGGVPSRQRSVAALRDRAFAIALRDPLETGDLAIDGGDLMKAGIKAGPELGATLRALLDWVLDDPARNTNDQLLARVRELAREQPHS